MTPAHHGLPPPLPMQPQYQQPPQQQLGGGGGFFQPHPQHAVHAAMAAHAGMQFHPPQPPAMAFPPSPGA